MKILYAIQGTGNGHLSRARDIIPILQLQGDLDILVSGTQADVELGYPVKYVFDGLSFVFGKKGGVDLFQTYKKSHLRKLFKEIRSLPVEKYDIIINDFEPVSAWACYLKNKACISLSHQAAVINKKSPQPKHKDILGNAILKNYAPTTFQYGFHFKEYDDNIFTPVIRKQVRALHPQNEGHYTVYLPAYSDKRIIKVLSECKGVRWQIFSKHNKKVYEEKNIAVYPINNESFMKSLASSEGVLCGAGFETPAEAMFLGKKLLVIPMKSQFEQHCNAAALKEMGVPILRGLKKKYTGDIELWIDAGERVSVDYPEITEKIIEAIFTQHYKISHNMTIIPGSKVNSAREFRKISLKKILLKIAVR
ncbi:MAG: glycosyltransferase family protein [Chitinophagaceae bacterium]